MWGCEDTTSTYEPDDMRIQGCKDTIRCEAGGSSNEELKICPPPSPAILWFVNVCKGKPR